MESKGERASDGSDTECKAPSPKRTKVEEGPSECSDASSKEVTVSEEDDEFTVESGSASEDHPSDSEEDFSDDIEEDEEEGSPTSIVCGRQGECVKSNEEMYSLHYDPHGREIKILTDESNFQNAISASSEKSKKKLIPVFLVTGVEVSKNSPEQLIIYAQKLSPVDEDYPEIAGDDQTNDKHIHGALLKVEDINEEFISTDFIQNED